MQLVSMRNSAASSHINKAPVIIAPFAVKSQNDWGPLDNQHLVLSIHPPPPQFGMYYVRGKLTSDLIFCPITEICTILFMMVQ